MFFFNPTIQLSVWDKPMDLQDRGDLNRIIEDPPHKRKKDSSEWPPARSLSQGSSRSRGLVVNPPLSVKKN